MPEISVILAAFNAEATIDRTLGSLAASSFADFECIIVDDGSTDTTARVIAHWQDRDPRIKLLENAENLGLSASLNRAIEVSSAPFLARLDADDLMAPTRLGLQRDVMRKNPELGVLGTGRYKIDCNDVVLGYVSPNCIERLAQWTSIWGVPFSHPTVMIRRETMEANRIAYDPAFRLAQDYDLWARLLAVCKGANINSPELGYRVHAGQATRHRVAERRANHDRVCEREVRRHLGRAPASRSVAAQVDVFSGSSTVHDETFRDAISLRQEVAELLGSQGADRSARVGLGLDLLRILRSPACQRNLRWLLRDGFRRQCLALAMPVYTREIVSRQYWRAWVRTGGRAMHSWR